MTRRKKANYSKRSSTSGSKKFDYLYLLERISGKERWSALTFQAEIKIGVTNRKPAERKKDVDEDMPGEVVLQQAIRIPGRAQVYERRLLTKWDKSFSPTGAGDSAGRTEWRRVTWLEYLFLLFDYWRIRHRYKIMALKLIIILLTILIYYHENR